MAQITINGIAIDPSAPRNERAALSLDHATAHDSDYIIVQTNQPLNAARREQLAKAGAEILEAVPGDAVICHFPTTGLSKVRALPFVTWADLYPGVVKIAPSLRGVDTQPGGVMASHAALAKPAALDQTRVTVDVILHRNVRAKQAARKVAAAAHAHLADLLVTSDKIRLTLKMRRLGDVAALDDVRSVEKVYPRKLANNVARDILRVPASPQDGGATGEGKGEIIAIADTGFDRGSTTDTHPAFKGRVKKLYALGRPGLKNDPDGHGTHVAGSALGDGVSKSDGPVRGTAPAARLVLQSVLDSGGHLGGLPNDLADLFGPPYKTDGARIHSNSWGTPGNPGVYDSQAREVDNFVNSHRDILICFAAGNEGKDGDANGQIDPNSVTPPATAKNCLTVGACESNRPTQALTYGVGFDYPANPIKSDRVANNPEGMVAFSSRGPTNDERIKPDVVAPGSYILSTRSRVTKSEGWLLSGDTLYMFDGGTSMATPLVAGCAAVIRAFLRNQKKLKTPSAALMKALIINGARNLTGQYNPSEAGIAANNNQGFGRVDVQAVVGPYAANETLQFFDEKKKLDADDREDREDRTIAIPVGVKRLKATLVWTDPPGEGLQSDLDLVVVANKQERHGNMPAGSKDFDRKNNVEQVVMDNLVPGNAVVSVIARSIAVAPQSYALVVRLS